MGKLVPDENNFVVKANKLIEAKGRLGVVEQKLLATLISKIKLGDEDFQEYKLEVKEIAEFINLNSNAVYEQLKLASRNLRSKEIVIELIDENGKRNFLVTGLLSSAKYKEGEGFIEVSIDPNLKPYLVAIKGDKTPFTKYMIKNILKLDSSYSIRLYEILKQCEKMRGRNIEIDELKEMLGADAKSYNLFAEFERRILKPSKNEINDKTDIFIIYKKIKTGRRISHIEFEIESRVGHHDLEEEEHKLSEKEKLFDYEFIKINSGMGEEKFSRKQIYEAYTLAVKRTESYGVDELAYIELNYIYAKERSKTGLYSYLIKSIDKDYAKAILKLAQIEM